MTNEVYNRTFFIAPIGLIGDLADWDRNEPTPQMYDYNERKIEDAMQRFQMQGNGANVRLAAFINVGLFNNVCHPSLPLTTYCMGRTQFEFDFTEARKDIKVVLEYNRRHPEHPLYMFFHLESGNYSYGPLMDHFFATDFNGDGQTHDYAQLDRANVPYVAEPYWVPVPAKYLTYSPSATQLRARRETNTRAAMRAIFEFLRAQGALKYIVGFESSSEIGFNGHGWWPTDYNVMILAQFRQYLQSRFGSLANINSQMGTSFPNIASIDPPRKIQGDGGASRGNWDFLFRESNPYWRAWRDFRFSVTEQAVEWEVGIIRSEWDSFLSTLGISRNGKKRIFSHQVMYSDVHGDIPQNAVTASGTMGLNVYTGYRSGSTEFQDMILPLASLDSGWIVGEFNPMTNVLADIQQTMQILYQAGVRIFAPYFHVFPQVDVFPAAGTVGISCLPGYDPAQFAITHDCAVQASFEHLLLGTRFDLGMRNFVNQYRNTNNNH